MVKIHEFGLEISSDDSLGNKWFNMKYIVVFSVVNFDMT
jgi:hypothetical protein